VVWSACCSLRISDGQVRRRPLHAPGHYWSTDWVPPHVFWRFALVAGPACTGCCPTLGRFCGGVVPAVLSVIPFGVVLIRTRHIEATKRLGPRDARAVFRGLAAWVLFAERLHGRAASWRLSCRSGSSTRSYNAWPICRVPCRKRHPCLVLCSEWTMKLAFCPGPRGRGGLTLSRVPPSTAACIQRVIARLRPAS
jgi:hypothetical protein